jgi:ketosteroid isomerase-like protein
VTESQWNKEIVREYFRCIRDEDLDRLLVYMDAAVELHVPGGLIGALCKGTADVRSYFERLSGVFEPGARVHVKSILSEGNNVFADTVLEGSFVESGRFEIRFFWLFSFHDRKIASITISYDTQALEGLTRQKESAAA